MQIWAESGKSALPICNYSQILYQFLTFTQNLKRSRFVSFSPFIIIEESNLQRFSHSLKFIKTPLKALFYLGFSAVPFRFTI